MQKSSAPKIVFQFGDAIFHVRPVVLVSPEIFRREREIADEDAEGVAGNIEKFSSQRRALDTQPLADHQKWRGRSQPKSCKWNSPAA